MDGAQYDVGDKGIGTMPIPYFLYDKKGEGNEMDPTIIIILVTWGFGWLIIIPVNNLLRRMAFRRSIERSRMMKSQLHPDDIECVLHLAPDLGAAFDDAIKATQLNNEAISDLSKNEVIECLVHHFVVMNKSERYDVMRKWRTNKMSTYTPYFTNKARNDRLRAEDFSVKETPLYKGFTSDGYTVTDRPRNAFDTGSMTEYTMGMQLSLSEKRRAQMELDSFKELRNELKEEYKGTWGEDR